MGCSYPIKIKNKYYNPQDKNFRSYKRLKYYYVPCGKCLGCQIAKREWLSTACNYEYNYYGCGSFTTLTYDDEHILHNWNEEKQAFMLNYKDFQDFMKRLRENLKRKYGCRRDFKMLAVGEYGGVSGRIHFHCLFFGLDYKADDKIIWDSWKNGIADNRPILNGGINYVLKYMDKAEMRKRNSLDYSFEKDERPFQYHSIGLGKGFIEEHIDEIIKNNGMYDKGDGKLRTLPKYWLNKLCIQPLINMNDVRKQMVAEHYTNKKGRVKNWYEISRTEVTAWIMNRSALKEKIAIQKAREEGNPQEDFDVFYNETIKREML